RRVVAGRTQPKEASLLATAGIVFHARVRTRQTGPVCCTANGAIEKTRMVETYGERGSKELALSGNTQSMKSRTGPTV
ncbi:hypothetical protein ACFL5Z_12870, partial [Planctomycetota bacterium]